MGVYERVIVGLDLVEATAPLVLTRACQVADAEVIEAVHVCDHLHHGHVDYGSEPAFRTSEELDDAVRHEAEVFLQRATAPYHIQERRVLSGHPATVLREHALGGAELIVVGTHGRHGWRTLLGSTTNAVVHGTPCSVLAVKIPEGEPEPPGPYRTVLVASNLQAETERLLQHVVRLAAASSARVVLCHVVSSGGRLAWEDAEARLRDLAGEFGLDPGSVCVRQGRPAWQIHELADALAADLVVVGTHGKHGVELLTGSTANAVLHGASCDTLSVRVPRIG